ncbi:MAG TPA: hypothetical protein VIL71_14275 [Spirillospora sp.]
MITVLVAMSLVALIGLSLPSLLRPMAPRPDRAPPAGEAAASSGALRTEIPAAEDVPDGSVPADPPPSGAVYPESMTAELDPADEEYLAFLANQLWPNDEYAELEHTTDGEEETGGSGMRL